LQTILLDRIAAGHLNGLDWFTPQRAIESCHPTTLMLNPASLLSVGIAYWGKGEDKPADGVPRGRISRYARGVDYHRLLPARMRALHLAMEALVGHPVEVGAPRDVRHRGQDTRIGVLRHPEEAPALAPQPSVLLLDEPFGALDAKVRQELRRWLREVHDRTGHTTPFVTHDQEEALELAALYVAG
jgi:ABC-type phosphonate transport system ATPase subunit